MPNWLATHNGRLIAFFLLYLTEGLPLGFSATFVATLMRQQGVSTDAIGWFVGILYLPWSFKWAVGPFVDLTRDLKYGSRRNWCLAAQCGMMLTLIACTGIDVQSITLLGSVVLINNIFGAIQDVAIDAMAVGALKPDERGIANGLMFAGASIGQVIGAVMPLTLVELPALGSAAYPVATLSVVAVFAAVFLLITLWLKEPRSPSDRRLSGTGALEELGYYVTTAGRVFLTTRRGGLGAVFALLPIGASSLSSALATNLNVELGLSNNEISGLTTATGIAFAAGCVFGGWSSDRLGRRRALTLFVLFTTVPTLIMAASLWNAGLMLPVETAQAADAAASPERDAQDQEAVEQGRSASSDDSAEKDGRAAADPDSAAAPPVNRASDMLIDIYWAMSLLFNVCLGLIYGTKMAFFMDLCDPRLVATQFTAYMSLMNLVITYSMVWQGYAIKHFGYPATMALDSLFGIVCLLVLPWIPLPTGSSRGEAAKSEPEVDAQFL